MKRHIQLDTQKHFSLAFTFSIHFRSLFAYLPLTLGRSHVAVNFYLTRISQLAVMVNETLFGQSSLQLHQDFVFDHSSTEQLGNLCNCWYTKY